MLHISQCVCACQLTFFLITQSIGILKTIKNKKQIKQLKQIKNKKRF